MAEVPMKIPPEARAYVRAAMRDTLAAYDLTDLLDLMADLCQENSDTARGGGQLGLSPAGWQIRADVLREAAERLDQQDPKPGDRDGA